MSEHFIQNGGLGQQGSADNKLRSAYNNFNTYRGEMENARKSADQKFDKSRLDASATMTSKGIKRNSNEWNAGMADVQRTYDASIAEANTAFEAYKTSAEFKSLESGYESGNVYDATKEVAGLTKDMFKESKPSFTEYYDLKYGSESKQNDARQLTTQRKTNVINMRAG